MKVSEFNEMQNYMTRKDVRPPEVQKALAEKIDEYELANIRIKSENKAKLETFINLFEKEKKRFPTSDEIVDNIDDTISLDLIQSVLTDIECKYKDINYKQEPIYATSGNSEV